MTSYNFTDGIEIIGTGIHTNASSIYEFNLDNELITSILIVIMLCQLTQTGYIFLEHIGLIKKWR